MAKNSMQIETMEPLIVLSASLGCEGVIYDVCQTPPVEDVCDDGAKLIDDGCSSNKPAPLPSPLPPKACEPVSPCTPAPEPLPFPEKLPGGDCFLPSNCAPAPILGCGAKAFDLSPHGNNECAPSVANEKAGDSDSCNTTPEPKTNVGCSGPDSPATPKTPVGDCASVDHVAAGDLLANGKPAGEQPTGNLPNDKLSGDKPSDVCGVKNSIPPAGKPVSDVTPCDHTDNPEPEPKGCQAQAHFANGDKQPNSDNPADVEQPEQEKEPAQGPESPNAEQLVYHTDDAASTPDDNQVGDPAAEDEGQPPAAPQLPEDVAKDDFEYREYDGSDNNLLIPELGAAGQQLVRLSPADASRLDDPELPTPREISNAVSAADGPIANDRGLSDYIWVWGQFLDHDLSLTEPPEDAGESANIPVPKGDKYFDPFGTGDSEIAFQRSDFLIDENGHRQQANEITAFIDASQVYGSDEELAARLRLNEAGKMQLSDGNLMPIVDDEGRPNFLAGDVRAAENVALSSMHSLFLREHNRLAELIAERDYPNADLTDPEIDEAIYQKARRIVNAQLQHITYNEFLPALLGDNALSEYKGYDETVNPGISTEFSTAAFRIGHTMLSSELLRLDENGETIADGNLALRDAFFQPQNLIDTGVDPILRGLAAQKAQEIDTQLVDDVRNFLFGPPGAGGLDLASLNIQRGRDHELPGYNEVRESLGLEKIESFHDISCDPEVVAKLKEVYDDVDQIDLWVGGLAEDHLEGSSAGETFTHILVDQFERLRDGDRFWYESSLTQPELEYVQQLSLSDIIAMNSNADLQDNVFFVDPKENTGSYYV